MGALSFLGSSLAGQGFRAEADSGSWGLSPQPCGPETLQGDRPLSVSLLEGAIVTLLGLENGGRAGEGIPCVSSV
jgi:hypothetical protein